MYLTAEELYVSAEQSVTGPEAAVFIAMMIVGFFILVAAITTYQDFRKTKIMAGQEDALRQLVTRYEQLAENSLDVQKRVAADIAEIHTRTSAIEQILRTVE